MIELLILFGLFVAGIFVLKIVFGVLGILFHLVLIPIKIGLGLLVFLLLLPIFVLLLPVFLICGLGVAALCSLLFGVCAVFCPI